MTFLLIVEDELPIRELVSFVCEREGFEVVGAADVGEACAALKTRRPDLILLDRMLPDRSGRVLARRFEEGSRDGRSSGHHADRPR